MYFTIICTAEISQTYIIIRKCVEWTDLHPLERIEHNKPHNTLPVAAPAVGGLWGVVSPDTWGREYHMWFDESVVALTL